MFNRSLQTDKLFKIHIMKDSHNQHNYTPAAEDNPLYSNEVDEVTANKTEGKDNKIELPANRVIRKRLAARTIGVHISALPPELQAFKETSASDSPYLYKYELPDKINLTVFGGDKKLFSRDEAWDLADEAGSKLEWDILPESVAGRATALVSTTGQGIYANYGRPTMDFSGFFHDYIHIHGKNSGSIITPPGLESVLLGPLFITLDTVSAAGFTALGHFTRGARLSDKTVLSDVVSTGVYEGTTSWASARLGVFTGAKVMRLAATLPIPGAHLAAIPLGFLVGATTAIFFKRFANQSKDSAIDIAYKPVVRSKVPKTTGKTVPA